MVVPGACAVPTVSDTKGATDAAVSAPVLMGPWIVVVPGACAVPTVSDTKDVTVGLMMDAAVALPTVSVPVVSKFSAPKSIFAPLQLMVPVPSVISPNVPPPVPVTVPVDVTEPAVSAVIVAAGDVRLLVAVTVWLVRDVSATMNVLLVVPCTVAVLGASALPTVSAPVLMGL